MDCAKTKPEFSTSFFGINIRGCAGLELVLRGFANTGRAIYLNAEEFQPTKLGDIVQVQQYSILDKGTLIAFILNEVIFLFTVEMPQEMSFEY